MSQLSCGSGHEDRHADEVSYRAQGPRGKLWPQTVFRSNFATHSTISNQAIQRRRQPLRHPTAMLCHDTKHPAVPSKTPRLALPEFEFCVFLPSLQKPFLSAENMKVFERSAVRQSSTFLQVTAKQTETQLLNLTLHYKVRGQGEHGISPPPCYD